MRQLTVTPVVVVAADMALTATPVAAAVTVLTVTRRSPVTPAAAAGTVPTATRRLTVSPAPAARVAITAMAVMRFRGSCRVRTLTPPTSRGPRTPRGIARIIQRGATLFL